MDADTPQFVKRLEIELSRYQALKETLEEERTLLVDRDFERFTRLLEQKHALLSALESDNQKRCDFLKAKSLPVSKAGIEALITALPLAQQHSVELKWQSLNLLIDDCARLNDINARITHRAQSSTHHMLSLLRGQSAGFELYGKKGTSTDRSRPLTITKV
ncbi:MAG: flagellar biosynthesis/type III secretory pathway chaperone [Candidatus Azotimanducaceae bacterium]|jgi:flagellar biosynthesis/type III secretory pathway chaperone